MSTLTVDRLMRTLVLLDTALWAWEQRKGTFFYCLIHQGDEQAFEDAVDLLDWIACNTPQCYPHWNALESDLHADPSMVKKYVEQADLYLMELVA